jgi:hypothetical protein
LLHKICFFMIFEFLPKSDFPQSPQVERSRSDTESFERTTDGG